jgi:3-hydroxybutyryl-CoA dehydrogenase
MSFLCTKTGMKIVVIGDDGLRKELESKAASGDQQWIWLRELKELSGHRNGDIYIDLEFEPESDRLEILQRLYPRPVLINSVIYPSAEIGSHFIRINAWPGFLGRPVLEIALPGPEKEDQIKALFKSLEWNYLVVPDINGMISPRVIAMIINEAYFTFQEKISSKEEIDTAMKLGTNYPMGPFEWSRKIGLKRIYELLLLLSQSDDRYRPAESLELEALSRKEKA